ncbi:MAG: DUF58 domain-containing protein [bacterium]|nr:DUF58 domain-containing protein [bacterium]
MSRSTIRTRPTRSGYLMILVLGAMLTASINYSNNMAYILTFLLFSLFLAGLLYTRNNIKGLDIVNLMPQPVFAGEMLRFTLELHNLASSRRYGIWLSYTVKGITLELSGPFSIQGESNSTAEISFHATRRGRFTLSQIELVTVYPLGLFLVRKCIDVDKEYLVYPHPEGTRPWPEPEVHSLVSGEGYHLKGGEDFTGMRPYRIGEPQHHVDWKAVARGRPMSIKEFTGGGSSQLWFNWGQLGGMTTEHRLSQLCKWVLAADEAGCEFGLKTPDLELAPGNSSTHTLRCLESLALYQFTS